MARPNRFADVLAAYDPVRLRAAFEACSRADDEGGYDRTTLNRWLDGSLPNRGDFVECLADQLGDAAVLEAWQEAKGQRSGSTARSVVSRFENLTADEKDWAFHEIRRDYVAAEYPSERSRMGYRIEISDPDDPDDDHLRLTVANSWTGDVPADATVQYVTEYRDLTSAYREPACIFREELPFEPERLEALLAAGDDPILAITPLDSPNPRPARHVGRSVEPGVYAFDNAGSTNAHVQVNISYPYPRQRPVFFIRWGSYQVPDTVEVTLVLRSRSASEPRAFPYMPPGRQQEWTSTLIRRNELFVSLGTGNTVLSEGDGLVLYWTEA